MLVLVAYYQLEKSRELQQEHLFLDALKHFHSETALYAKTYIHEIFTKYYSVPAQKDTHHLHDQSVAKTSIDVVRLLNLYHNTGNKNEDERNNKLAIHLINWLEYLEMLCFYYDQEIISKNHFKELFQHTIKFQFEVFKDYLDSRSGERFGYFKKVHDELCCFPLKNSQSIKS